MVDLSAPSVSVTTLNAMLLKAQIACKGSKVQKAKCLVEKLPVHKLQKLLAEAMNPPADPEATDTRSSTAGTSSRKEVKAALMVKAIPRDKPLLQLLKPVDGCGAPDSAATGSAADTVEIKSGKRKGDLCGAPLPCKRQQLAADTSSNAMVKSIREPWCNDVAAGLKCFECVANRQRFTNQFKTLKAGDLFVVVR